MLFLHPHHITELFCMIDEIVPKKPYVTGRPALLSTSEVITILVWNTIALHEKNLVDMHRTLSLYHRADFPRLPAYSTFVAQCHRALPQLFECLCALLSNKEAKRIMDSTMLPVCKLHRADRHKTAKTVARFGKNHQGWHYGFKLHASISFDRKLCGLALTPANVYDAQMEYLLLNEHTRVVVGDTHYGASVMRSRMWRRYATIIITPPHHTQKKKIAAPWQIDLLNLRAKIESVFDYLKEHLHLVSSFPRSVAGYILHYVRILLSYQIMALCKGV